MIDATHRTAILAARAEALRRPRVAPDLPDSVEVLAFRTGTEQFAIRLDETLGVHRVADLTPVPGAPAAVRGVALLAGEILALVDIGALTGSSEKGLSDLRHAIVVESAGRRVAILAAEVEGIERIGLASLRRWETRDSAREGKVASWIEGLIGEDRPLINLSLFMNQIDLEVKRQ